MCAPIKPIENKANIKIFDNQPKQVTPDLDVKKIDSVSASVDGKDDKSIWKKFRRLMPFIPSSKKGGELSTEEQGEAKDLIAILHNHSGNGRLYGGDGRVYEMESMIDSSEKGEKGSKKKACELCKDIVRGQREYIRTLEHGLIGGRIEPGSRTDREIKAAESYYDIVKEVLRILKS